MPDRPPTPPIRPLILLNLNAGGTGDGRAAAALRERFPAATFVNPGSPEESISAIERRDINCDAVIVGGGDGSISAILAPLLDAALPLGVIPLGTANDFARGIGIESLDAALDTIIRGATRDVDLGCCNGRLFLNAIAVGLPAATARVLTTDLKRRLGMFAAVAVVPRILRRGRAFDVTVEDANGIVRVEHAIAILGSAGRYIGGVPVEYHHLSDGRLYVTIARARAWHEVLSILVSALLRRLPQDWNVTEIATTACAIRTSRLLDVAVDGDVALRTPIELSIRPGALRVFAPVSY